MKLELKNLLHKIREITVALNVKYFFLIMFVLQLIPSLISLIFNIDSTNNTVSVIEKSGSKIVIFLITVVWGPIFETVVFQYLLINMVKAFTSDTKYQAAFSVLIPSVIFGLTHYYNIYYFIFAIFIGIIYSSTYYISQFLRKENGFIIVLLLHSLNNLLAFLI